MNEQRVLKNNGKRFEQDFKNSFNENIWTYRPPDSGGGQLARFTQESLCDLIAYNTNNGKLILCELKSTLGTAVSFKTYEQCMNYETELCKFNEWNSKQNAKTRAPIKEEIKEHKKYLKGLYKETNQAMIKYHQIKTLYEISNKYENKIKTYFVFTFFKTNKTYAVTVLDFYEYWKTTTKKSINQVDLQTLANNNKAIKLNQNFIGRSMKSKYQLDILVD